MKTPQDHPSPQPTESEAIVAAQRAQDPPATPLANPVPLPVEVAAALPVDQATPAPATPFGSRENQEERRTPSGNAAKPLEQRRKDDAVGGESGA